MQITDAVDQLLEKRRGLRLGDTLSFHDVVEKLAPVRVLHDQVDPCRSIEHIVQLNDVSVPVAFQDVDLSGHPPHVTGVYDSVFFQDFDGHFFSRQGMHARLYPSKRSFSNGLAEVVGTKTAHRGQVRPRTQYRGISRSNGSVRVEIGGKRLL